jgi:hypothetical protein
MRNVMASRNARQAAVPASASLVIWLAGLVFGVSAGLLLVYHFLTSSRNVDTLPIDSATAAPAQERHLGAATRGVDTAHSEALKAALKAQQGS